MLSDFLYPHRAFMNYPPLNRNFTSEKIFLDNKTIVL